MLYKLSFIDFFGLGFDGCAFLISVKVYISFGNLIYVFSEKDYQAVGYLCIFMLLDC